MRRIVLLILIFSLNFSSSRSFADDFCKGLVSSKKIEMPIGKGRAPKFSMTIPENWSVESARKAGDRWVLKDIKTKKPVAKMEWDLSNTDQKMLPVILESTLKIGKFSLEKLTVSTSPEAQNEETRAKVTEGLITSYRFEESSKLSKLALMSEEYEKSSCLETALEKILGSIALK